MNDSIIDRLRATVNRFLQEPDMKKNLDQQGMIATGGTPQAYGQRIRREYGRRVKVVNDAGIKSE